MKWKTWHIAHYRLHLTLSVPPIHALPYPIINCIPISPFFHPYPLPLVSPILHYIFHHPPYFPYHPFPPPLPFLYYVPISPFYHAYRLPPASIPHYVFPSPSYFPYPLPFLNHVSVSPPYHLSPSLPPASLIV